MIGNYLVRFGEDFSKREAELFTQHIISEAISYNT